MPLLLPIFMFLAGLLGAGHVVSTVVIANEQAQLRAADSTQTLAQFNQNIQSLLKAGHCQTEASCADLFLGPFRESGVCQDATGCAQYCSQSGAKDAQCNVFIVSAGDISPQPPPAPTCPSMVGVTCPYGYVTDDQGCQTGECAGPPSDGDGAGEEGCIRDGLKGIKDFERDSLRDIERRIRDLEREKIVVPEAVKTLVGGIKSLLTKAKAQTTCGSMIDVINEGTALYNELNDQLNELQRAVEEVRCVRDNLRSLKDFERSTIRDLERRIKQVQRQKVSVPTEITQTLERMKQLLTQAKQSTKCPDLNDLQQELSSLQNEIQEKFEELEFLAQVPRMLKEITRELKRTEGDWNRVVRLAKRSKADLSGLVAQGDEIIAFLKAKFAELKAAVATGDVQQIKNVADEGGQEAQEKKEDLEGIQRIIEALGNAPRHLKDLARRLSEFRRTIRQIARDGGDPSALQGCVENFTSLLEAAKSTVAKRPIDPDELVEVFSQLEETGQECDDAANQAFEQHEDGVPE